MNKSISFGIVQGRLTQSPPGCLQWFPQDDWQNEFSIASEIGIDYIELIAEVQHNTNNPIWTDEGISQIKELVEKNNLNLHVLCNDYIIENSLLDERVVQQNISLIKQASKLGVEKFILPFFESSELSQKNMQNFLQPLKKVAKEAFVHNINVCLETILTGHELIKLLDLVDLPNVKVVYDTGNRVAFGHDLAGDIRLLNGNIEHIHIKDKNQNNENVLLGTGLVNFQNIFEALSDINYTGPYTFETTRGSNPIETAKYNMSLVDFFHKNSNISV